MKIVSNKPSTWVKLYLEAQSSNTNMPDYVIGIMHSETPLAYCLVAMLVPQDVNGEMQLVPKEKGMDFINKTYVWRCEILEEEPEFIIPDVVTEAGGLG